MKYKISHNSLKKVKHITDEDVSLEINGQNITVNIKELEDLFTEVSFSKKLKASYSNHSLFSRLSNGEEFSDYKYYHSEIRENVSKFLIGKDLIDLEEDYIKLNNIPFMKLKSIYEVFYRFNLISNPTKGKVLIKSMDDLIEPTIVTYES